MKACNPSKFWLRAPHLVCNYLGNRWKQAGRGQINKEVHSQSLLPQVLLAISHNILLWLWGGKDREVMWEHCERVLKTGVNIQAREWREASGGLWEAEWHGQSTQKVKYFWNKCRKCLKWKVHGRLGIKLNRKRWWQWLQE